MWLYTYLNVQLGPAGPRTCSIDYQLKAPQHQGQLFNTRHELSSVIPSSSPNHFHTFNRCQNLIATVLHTPQTLSKITEPPTKGVNISLHSSGSLIHKCQNYSPYIYHPLQVFSSSLLMKTSCLRLKLVELNFLVSFNTDDQRKIDVANAINVITLVLILRWNMKIWILKKKNAREKMNQRRIRNVSSIQGILHNSGKN